MDTFKWFNNIDPSVRYAACGAGVISVFAGATTGLEALSVFLPTVNPKAAELDNPFYAFNHWINEFLFPDSVMQYAHDKWGEQGAHYTITYIRDFIAGSILYYLVAGLWHLYIYNYKGEQYFTQQGAKMPSPAIIRDQILLAQLSMFCYAGLPVFSEWLIETGKTKVYWSADEVGGWHISIAYMALYLTVVEIGVYWMHRTLHTNKFLYKYVHGLHHKYNKPELLSPWASVAFNPLDGILQASPYVVTLFIVPCHYLTHVAMLFFTAIWATNIHDALNGNTEPIMGSKYHTIHHTHYHYNFGQFFIFCDWYWGSLRDRKDLIRSAKKST